jgi:hypothetical protein
MRRLRTVERALLGMLSAAALAAAAPAADAQRGIPVGMYNVDNQVMNSGRYLYALRFVVDHDTTIHRFISGFTLEGSRPFVSMRRRGMIRSSRPGYAGGTGGTIRARLVRVRPDGTPDLRAVLAEETVGAVRRWRQSSRAFGVPRSFQTMLLYFEFGGVPIRAGVPYAVVYQNREPRPGTNWFSENSPTVRASEAGPNGRNTLNPAARGAIAGLDPREAVGWSTNRGRSWVWGRRVGEGHTSGAHAGSTRTDDGARLPWYGWQPAPGVAPRSNQPWYAYKRRGNYRLRVGPVTAPQVLSQAGGYAPLGSYVGEVTVSNLATGAVGRTRLLGGGIASGNLWPPVPVAPGETYEISHSGTVLRQEGDEFIRRTFGADTLSAGGTVQTIGAPSAQAQLFALP